MIGTYLKRHRYGVLALALIALAVILRLILLANNWPNQSAEEGTFGLEALHIAYNGAHPIFMYGQNYMGVLESYLDVPFFYLFGVNWFTLRLSVVLLFALFLLALYFLTKLLYTPKLALFTLLLLTFGSFEILQREMMIVGGSMETLLFGTLLMLLATHLSLTTGKQLSAGKRWLRLAGFAAWGCCAGLGLWSHLLVAPFVLTSGLLLLWFCHREILSLAPLLLLAGFVVGLTPLIAYNLQAGPGQDSLTAFLQIYNMGASSHTGFQVRFLEKQFMGTFLFALPTQTGMNALYDPRPLPFYPFSGLPTPTFSVLAELGWSMGYLLLLALAFGMAGLGFWQLYRRRKSQEAPLSVKEQHVMVIYASQLMLLLSAALTILLFLHSADAATRPWSVRYLVGLLAVTPALLWPLWNGVTTRLPAYFPAIKQASLAMLARRIVLVLLVCLFAGEMLFTTTQMSAYAADNAQVVALTHDLLQRGITRIYSGYWQCDRFTFITQEKLICATSWPTGLGPHSRYRPYDTIVRSDPDAAYVFPPNTDYTQSMDKKIAVNGWPYHKITLDGYSVYLHN
jgi:hypothetical protein